MAWELCSIASSSRTLLLKFLSCCDSLQCHDYQDTAKDLIVNEGETWLAKFNESLVGQPYILNRILNVQKVDSLKCPALRIRGGSA